MANDNDQNEVEQNFSMDRNEQAGDQIEFKDKGYSVAKGVDVAQHSFDQQKSIAPEFNEIDSQQEQRQGEQQQEQRQGERQQETLNNEPLTEDHGGKMRADEIESVIDEIENNNQAQNNHNNNLNNGM